MSLLTGAAGIGSAVGGIQSIANALFPKQIIMRIISIDLDIPIDATQNISTNTSVEASEHPAEDSKTFLQNVQRQPTTISLIGILSSVLRLSDIRSLAAASKFASSLLVPEVASISNVLLNEEDSVSVRLRNLREAQSLGSLIQVIGIPDQDVFNFYLQSITDNDTVETGPKARAVDIVLREAEIVGLAGPQPEQAGLFSKITSTITGAINSLPGAIGDAAAAGISGI